MVPEVRLCASAAGDTGSIPGLGTKIPDSRVPHGTTGEKNSIAAISNSVLQGEINFMGFPGSSEGEESGCNVGDLGSILGLGRCPGEGKGYPLQHSGLENTMDCIVHRVAKCRS